MKVDKETQEKKLQLTSDLMNLLFNSVNDCS